MRKQLEIKKDGLSWEGSLWDTKKGGKRRVDMERSTSESFVLRMRTVSKEKNLSQGPVSQLFK